MSRPVPEPSENRYDLRRFVEAQNPVYEQVCAELRAGLKRGHWMWFIFPQIKGLGHSSMARRYAISSLQEAEEYLLHPVAGPRLKECCRIVNGIEGRVISDIFDYPDDLKFHSSMTLFARATSDNALFLDALQKYFGGQPDERTLERL
jgi:uncharacterized protein (DUF1810 family)